MTALGTTPGTGARPATPGGLHQALLRTHRPAPPPPHRTPTTAAATQPPHRHTGAAA
ncbi:hypothetical protein ACFT4A_27015 [Streptomyces sp. NPDC057099]|uniref:hypothetical protein n=1 Tax=Streptomyces sp. NPDC057099 TaxID=3346019 RepID=UPI00362A6EC2